jgi:hypothetical protein
VKLHERSLFTSDELDLIEAILGNRKAFAKGSNCSLADALQKCAGELLEQRKLAAG